MSCTWRFRNGTSSKYIEGVSIMMGDDRSTRASDQFFSLVACKSRWGYVLSGTCIHRAGKPERQKDHSLLPHVLLAMCESKESVHTCVSRQFHHSPGATIAMSHHHPSNAHHRWNRRIPQTNLSQPSLFCSTTYTNFTLQSNI